MMILLKLNCSEHVDFNKVSHEKGQILEKKNVGSLFYGTVAATGIK